MPDENCAWNVLFFSGVPGHCPFFRTPNCKLCDSSVNHLFGNPTMAQTTLCVPFSCLFRQSCCLLCRFGMSSTESGFLVSMNDIVGLALVLFTGYLGKKVNKPRYLGLPSSQSSSDILTTFSPLFSLEHRYPCRSKVTCVYDPPELCVLALLPAPLFGRRLLGILNLISGVGVLLFALPYVVYPRQLDDTQSANTTTTLQLCKQGGDFSHDDSITLFHFWHFGFVLTMRPMKRCPNGDYPVGDTGPLTQQCSEAALRQTQAESSAYVLFLVAASLNGLANTGLTVLTLSYIDENTPKVQSPLYIGILSDLNTPADDLKA